MFIITVFCILMIPLAESYTAFFFQQKKLTFRRTNQSNIYITA